MSSNAESINAQRESSIQRESCIKEASILMTGASGFIGSSLVQALLAEDCSITALTRNPEKAAARQGQVKWVSSFEQIDSLADQHFDYVINLAGESLAEGRWSNNKKARLLTSRVGTTQKLCRFLAKLERKPKRMLSASAIGYYGFTEEGKCDESEGFIESSAVAPEHQQLFSHQLCDQWERSAQAVTEQGIELCCTRFGVVLDGRGGAYLELKKSFDFGVGTYFGRGEHCLSWVHLQDVVRALIFLLTHPNPEHDKHLDFAKGCSVNVCAPQAVSYRQFATTLAQYKSTFFTASIPPVLMRLVFGQMAEELLLNGQKVRPQALESLGFRFLYPQLEQALAQINS